MASIGRNIAFKTGAEGVSRAGKLAVAMLAARWLGPDAYGGYTWAFAAAYLLGECSDLGLNVLLTREVARSPQAAAGALRRILPAKLALTGAAVLAALAAGLAVGGARGTLVGILAAGMLALSLADFACQALRGLQRLDLEAGVSIAGSATASGLGILAVVLGFKALGLAIGTALGAGSALAVAALVLSRTLPRGQGAGEGRGNALLALRALGPLVTMMLMSRAYFQVDLLLIGRLGTASDVAQFGVALKPVAGAMVLPTVIMAAVFPAFSSPGARQRQLAGRTLVFLTAAGALVGLGFWLGAGALIELLFGEDYRAAAAPLQVLGAALLWMFPEYALAQLLFAAGRQRPLAMLWTGAMVAIVALELVAIPRWGLAGAAAVKAVVTLGLVLGEALVLAGSLDPNAARELGGSAEANHAPGAIP